MKLSHTQLKAVCCYALGMLVTSMAATVHANHGDVHNWDNPDGGLFVGGTGGVGIPVPGTNWDPNGVPAAGDVARFDIGDEQYTVDFDDLVFDPPLGDPIVFEPPGELDQLIVGNDEVTFNLRGLDYSITGPSSSPADLVVGESAGIFGTGADDGTLTVFNGSLLTNGVRIGEAWRITTGGPVHAQGTLNIQTDAALEPSGALIVGNAGSGELNLAGRVTGGSGLIGWLGTGIGSASVAGPSACWELEAPLHVGGAGVGTLDITNGGAVDASLVNIGRSAGGVGTANVGTGNVVGGNVAELTASQLVVGREGLGTLNIVNDGLVTAKDATIAQMPDSVGTVNVDGIGKWSGDPGANLIVGEAGEGALDIAEEGDVEFVDITVGDTQASTGAITVSGQQARLTAADALYVGNRGPGTLTVSNGGNVRSTTGAIAAFDTSPGEATVTGDHSEWINTGSLGVGGTPDAAGGVGHLSIENHGRVDVEGTLVIWDDGTVDIEGGDLDADDIDNDNGGVLDLLGGRLAVTAVEGPLDNQASTVAPGGDALTVASVGNYQQFSEGTLEVELTGTDNSDPLMPQHDVLQVDRTATLDGTLKALLTSGDDGPFQPAAGDRFDILSAGDGVTGEFANVSLPGLDGDLSWNVNYGSNAVTLEILADILAGDYNGNGRVEQGDLDLVLLNWGEDAATPPVEWINDLPNGIIDQAELDGVLLNWGATAARLGGASIPEPASGLLLCIAIALLTAAAVRGKRGH